VSADPTEQVVDAAAYKLLIGGRLVAGAATLDVVNPATGRSFAKSPRADAAQLNEAVAAARAAFPGWAITPITERRRLLVSVAGLLSGRSEEFARLLTREQGKPLAEARFEVDASVALTRAFAGMDLPVRVLRDSNEDRIVQHRVPLGVVAAITPWNFPLFLLMIKAAPALLAGNTLVAKPAPTTPLTTLLFGRLCAEVFPAGVVNVVVDENDLGNALTGHPDVSKVAFTGSTATGKRVMASAAAGLKRLTLELGGNDAAIVLPDARVPDVAPRIFQAAMLNAGQVCFAIKRLYVHESHYEDMCRELAVLADSVVVDDGLAEGSQLGPLQNKAQFDKVKAFIADAHACGRVIAGGKVLERDGYFVAPTIVRDIADDARLVREEQFGPVLPVLRYADIQDAIIRANGSEYGLGATVWGADLERAYQVASKLEAGTVWVNKHLDLPPDIPFSGVKQSGFGAEMGQEGLEEFTQSRVINLAKAAVA
jgi:acyl-CoA reductase-like NAD-dependent aldehyde dehydrogenase